ncbi:MAG: methionyl-tRNA formyltransferase [Dehalococcoidales bacterium]|nr:methionyl-tRNA formyltransferase [Dehalococcoidales bacterium]
MRLVFFGSPEFAVPALEHLLVNGHQVAAVYTQPDRPAGRGRALVPPPVKEAALRRGLPVYQPERLKDPAEVEQLAKLAPEAIVVAAFGQILPQSVLDIPPFKCINVHPSLLPRFRGAAPVPAAILSGDAFTGVSIMLLDRGMDTGPVLLQAAVLVAPGDNTGSLSGKLAQVGARLLTEALVRWRRGEIQPQPQDNAQATYTRPFTKEDGKIDWQRPALEIWRRIRAFNPWPGCYTTWQGKQLKIMQAVPRTAESVPAGQVVTLNKDCLGIGTGEGILEVRLLQLEGKKPVSAADFRNGQRDFIGALLPD